MATTKEQEKELLMQADPMLRKQYEAKLLREADPQLNGRSDYNPNVSLNSLGLIPPTTPPGQQPTVEIPGANLINYANVTPPPPARAPLSWGEMFRGMYENGGESLKKFAHSVYDTLIDPYGAANAITNGLPTVEGVESAVNATPAMLGGIALDQLSPEVRALVVKDHPELQPAEEKGKTASEAAHNVAKATADYLGTYAARPGEPTGTGLWYNLHDKPIQTLSDLSIPASLGAGAVAKMGLNAAWRASLAESLIAKGLPGGVAQAAVNAPRVAVNMMNPINWVTYPTGKVVSGTTRAVANALTPQRRAMMALVNNDLEKAKQVEAKLKDTIANPIIEGSNPTAAEALEPNPRGAVPGAAAEPTDPNLLLGGGNPTLQLPAGGNVPQLPGGPGAALLEEAPSVDSLLLDGHNLEAIAAPKPPVAPGATLLDEAAAPPVRPVNALVREGTPDPSGGYSDHWKGFDPYAEQPQMNNALNQARPVEPEAPPRQAPPEPQQEARPVEPEPTPQPEPQAPPEAAQAETAAPASDFDFMGRQKEVQQFIDQHPHMEAMFQKAVTKSEKDIAKAEEGLLSSTKYGQKFIDIAKMNNLGQQEAAFNSWIADEPADKVAEITRHYNNLKKSTLTAEAAKRRITELSGELEGWQAIMDKLVRGEEGHLDINAVAGAINKKIADYHAKNAAAGVVTLPPHPGVGPRGVARTGTPGVLAQKFSAAGEQARLNNPDPFTELYNQNNAARMKVNNSLGKTGPAGNVDRPTAEAQHKALAKAEYGAAATKLSTADATFQRLTNRDLSKGVMERARKYMGESDEPLEIGTYVPAHTDPTGKFVPAVYPKYSGKALQAIKQAFDDIAFDKNVIENGGASAADLLKIQATRAEFLRWVGLRGNNPELITAMKNYSARENQIARMKLAEHLESILQKDSKDEFTLRQRADAYADAIHPNKQAKTLRDATGRGMYSDFSQLVTPKELENIQSIKDDLMREVLAKDHAIAGRDHSGIINTAASDGIGRTHIPGQHGMFNQLRELVMGGTDERVKKRISKGMETAEGGLKLMSNALRQQEGFDIVGEAARKTGRTINNLTTKVPTAYNVTEQQRDAKKKKGGTR